MASAHIWSSRRRMHRLVAVVLLAVPACAGFGVALAQDASTPLKDAREAFIASFRESGTRDPAQYMAALARAEAAARTLGGVERIGADIEIATAYRLLSRFSDAAMRYEAAARAAASAGRSDLAFEAWIGAARAYQYGGDPGRAAPAYESAVGAAGAQPARKQAHDLAAFGAQLSAGRGELDAGLVGALETAALAAEPLERFYAASELGSVYLNLLESCDYRPIEDARSAGDDPYGACRRAADAGDRAFADAAKQADALGWRFLAEQSRGFQRSLRTRRMMVDMHARAQSWRTRSVFAPTRAADVLVNQNFLGGSSTDAATTAVAELGERTAASGDGALALGLRGDSASLRGDVPAALRFYERAAQRIEQDRAGYFDPRRRGTVIERFTSVLVNRALAQLQLGMEAEAFAGFEAMRSRGLSELAAALASPGVSAEDRAWLARLTRIEAQLSAAQGRVARRAVAEGAGSLTDAEARQFAELRRARSDALSDEARRRRFAAASYRPADLAQLRAAVRRSGVPVLLYWVTPTNVVGWLEAPGVSRVRSIFLPGAVVTDRVRRVRASAERQGAYDVEAARQLYLYLIAPFEAELGAAASVMIVPQGELTELPFEALVAPDGRYLVERRSVGYATNATFAVAALARDAPPRMRVAAIYDEAAETLTGDVKAIGRHAVVTPQPASRIYAGAAGRVAASAPVLHVLAHGVYDFDEPLLSRVAFGTPVYAADIVGWPLGGTDLAVFSACDSGMQGRLVSNELFGFPWALAAAGARNAVVSRWRLPQAAHARWAPAFYAALARGATPSGAATEAARQMLATGDRHPHGWAAMQVMGR